MIDEIDLFRLIQRRKNRPCSNLENVIESQLGIFFIKRYERYTGKSLTVSVDYNVCLAPPDILGGRSYCTNSVRLFLIFDLIQTSQRELTVSQLGTSVLKIINNLHTRLNNGQSSVKIYRQQSMTWMMTRAKLES